MRFIKIYTILTFLTLLSCKKKEVVVCAPSQVPLTGSWLVLNEGLFQQNNSSVTKIEAATGNFSNGFFGLQAGRPLGDTGNDMKRYGNKIYIVVNISSTIEIIDATTGAFVKQILMQNAGQAKQPRFIDFESGKAFISCYDGYVDVLDTVSLTITNRIQVGSNPDHLAIAGNKVYVSNSGGLNFPSVDSTVSVIDVNTEIELSKITIGKNPGSIAIAGNGDVFVVTRGNFSSILPRMHRISGVTDTKEESYSFDVTNLSNKNGDIVVFESEGQASIRLFDVANNQLSSQDEFNLNDAITPFKVVFDTPTQKYFLFDANGYVNEGFIFEFDSNGQYLSKTKTGLVPTAVLTF